MKRLTETKGYTLIEVLAAVAVLSIGLAAVMPLTVSRLRSNDEAEVRTRALAIAQGFVEKEFRQPAFNALAFTGNTTDPVNSEYKIEWEITNPDHDPNIQQIQVIVKWDGPRGEKSLATLFSSKSNYQ